MWAAGGLLLLLGAQLALAVDGGRDAFRQRVCMVGDVGGAADTGAARAWWWVRFLLQELLDWATSLTASAAAIAACAVLLRRTEPEPAPRPRVVTFLAEALQGGKSWATIPRRLQFGFVSTTPDRRPSRGVQTPSRSTLNDGASSDETVSLGVQASPEGSAEDTQLQDDAAPTKEKRSMAELERKPPMEELQEKPQLEELPEKPQLEELPEKPQLEELQEKPLLEELQEKPQLEKLQEKTPSEALQEKVSLEVVQEKAPLEVVQDKKSLEELHEAPSLKVLHERASLEALHETERLEVLQEKTSLEVRHETPASEMLHEKPSLEVLHERGRLEVVQEKPSLEEKALLEEKELSEENIPEMALPEATRRSSRISRDGGAQETRENVVQTSDQCLTLYRGPPDGQEMCPRTSSQAIGPSEQLVATLTKYLDAVVTELRVTNSRLACVLPNLEHAVKQPKPSREHVVALSRTASKKSSQLSSRSQPAPEMVDTVSSKRLSPTPSVPSDRGDSEATIVEEEGSAAQTSATSVQAQQLLAEERRVYERRVIALERRLREVLSELQLTRCQLAEALTKQDFRGRQIPHIDVRSESSVSLVSSTMDAMLSTASVGSDDSDSEPRSSASVSPKSTCTVVYRTKRRTVAQSSISSTSVATTDSFTSACTMLEDTEKVPTQGTHPSQSTPAMSRSLLDITGDESRARASQQQKRRPASEAASESSFLSSLSDSGVDASGRRRSTSPGSTSWTDMTGNWLRAMQQLVQQIRAAPQQSQSSVESTPTKEDPPQSSEEPPETSHQDRVAVMKKMEQQSVSPTTSSEVSSPAARTSTRSLLSRMVNSLLTASSSTATSRGTSPQVSKAPSEAVVPSTPKAEHIQDKAATTGLPTSTMPTTESDVSAGSLFSRMMRVLLPSATSGAALPETRSSAANSRAVSDAAIPSPPSADSKLSASAVVSRVSCMDHHLSSVILLAPSPMKLDGSICQTPPAGAEVRSRSLLSYGWCKAMGEKLLKEQSLEDHSGSILSYASSKAPEEKSLSSGRSKANDGQSLKEGTLTEESSKSFLSYIWSKMMDERSLEDEASVDESRDLEQTKNVPTQIPVQSLALEEKTKPLQKDPAKLKECKKLPIKDRSKNDDTSKATDGESLKSPKEPMLLKDRSGSLMSYGSPKPVGGPSLKEQESLEDKIRSLLNYVRAKAMDDLSLKEKKSLEDHIRCLLNYTRSKAMDSLSPTEQESPGDRTGSLLSSDSSKTMDEQSLNDQTSLEVDIRSILSDARSKALEQKLLEDHIRSILIDVRAKAMGEESLEERKSLEDHIKSLLNFARAKAMDEQSLKDQTLQENRSGSIPSPGRAGATDVLSLKVHTLLEDRSKSLLSYGSSKTMDGHSLKEEASTGDSSGSFLSYIWSKVMDEQSLDEDQSVDESLEQVQLKKIPAQTTVWGRYKGAQQEKSKAPGHYKYSDVEARVKKSSRQKVSDQNDIQVQLFKMDDSSATESTTQSVSEEGDAQKGSKSLLRYGKSKAMDGQPLKEGTSTEDSSKSFLSYIWSKVMDERSLEDEPSVHESLDEEQTKNVPTTQEEKTKPLKKDAGKLRERKKIPVKPLLKECGVQTEQTQEKGDRRSPPRKQPQKVQEKRDARSPSRKVEEQESPKARKQKLLAKKDDGQVVSKKGPDSLPLKQRQDQPLTKSGQIKAPTKQIDDKQLERSEFQEHTEMQTSIPSKRSIKSISKKTLLAMQKAEVLSIPEEEETEVSVENYEAQPALRDEKFHTLPEDKTIHDSQQTPQPETVLGEVEGARTESFTMLAASKSSCTQASTLWLQGLQRLTQQIRGVYRTTEDTIQELAKRKVSAADISVHSGSLLSCAVNTMLTASSSSTVSNLRKSPHAASYSKVKDSAVAESVDGSRPVVGGASGDSQLIHQEEEFGEAPSFATQFRYDESSEQTLKTTVLEDTTLEATTIQGEKGEDETICLEEQPQDKKTRPLGKKRRPSIPVLKRRPGSPLKRSEGEKLPAVTRTILEEEGIPEQQRTVGTQTIKRKRMSRVMAKKRRVPKTIEESLDEESEEQSEAEKAEEKKVKLDMQPSPDKQSSAETQREDLSVTSGADIAVAPRKSSFAAWTGSLRWLSQPLRAAALRAKQRASLVGRKGVVQDLTTDSISEDASKPKIATTQDTVTTKKSTVSCVVGAMVGDSSAPAVTLPPPRSPSECRSDISAKDDSTVCICTLVKDFDSGSATAESFSEDSCTSLPKKGPASPPPVAGKSRLQPLPEGSGDQPEKAPSEQRLPTPAKSAHSVRSTSAVMTPSRRGSWTHTYASWLEDQQKVMQQLHLPPLETQADTSAPPSPTFGEKLLRTVRLSSPSQYSSSNVPSPAGDQAEKVEISSTSSMTSTLDDWRPTLEDYEDHLLMPDGAPPDQRMSPHIPSHVKMQGDSYGGAKLEMKQSSWTETYMSWLENQELLAMQLQDLRLRKELGEPLRTKPIHKTAEKLQVPKPTVLSASKSSLLSGVVSAMMTAGSSSCVSASACSSICASAADAPKAIPTSMATSPSVTHVPYTCATTDTNQTDNLMSAASKIITPDSSSTSVATAPIPTSNAATPAYTFASSITSVPTARTHSPCARSDTASPTLTHASSATSLATTVATAESPDSVGSADITFASSISSEITDTISRGGESCNTSIYAVSPNAISVSSKYSSISKAYSSKTSYKPKSRAPSPATKSSRSAPSAKGSRGPTSRAISPSIKFGRSGSNAVTTSASSAKGSYGRSSRAASPTIRSGQSASNAMASASGVKGSRGRSSRAASPTIQFGQSGSNAMTSASSVKGSNGRISRATSPIFQFGQSGSNVMASASNVKGSRGRSTRATSPTMKFGQSASTAMASPASSVKGSHGRLSRASSPITKFGRSASNATTTSASSARGSYATTSRAPSPISEIEPPVDKVSTNTEEHSSTSNRAASPTKIGRSVSSATTTSASSAKRSYGSGSRVTSPNKIGISASNATTTSASSARGSYAPISRAPSPISEIESSVNNVTTIFASSTEERPFTSSSRVASPTKIGRSVSNATTTSVSSAKDSYAHSSRAPSPMNEFDQIVSNVTTISASSTEQSYAPITKAMSQTIKVGRSASQSPETEELVKTRTLGASDASFLSGVVNDMISDSSASKFVQYMPEPPETPEVQKKAVLDISKASFLSGVVNDMISDSSASKFVQYMPEPPETPEVQKKAALDISKASFLSGVVNDMMAAARQSSDSASIGSSTSGSAACTAANYAHRVTTAPFPSAVATSTNMATSVTLNTSVSNATDVSGTVKTDTYADSSSAVSPTFSSPTTRSASPSIKFGRSPSSATTTSTFSAKASYSPSSRAASPTSKFDSSASNVIAASASIPKHSCVPSSRATSPTTKFGRADSQPPKSPEVPKTTNMSASEASVLSGMVNNMMSGASSSGASTSVCSSLIAGPASPATMTTHYGPSRAASPTFKYGRSVANATASYRPSAKGGSYAPSSRASSPSSSTVSASSTRGSSRVMSSSASSNATVDSRTIKVETYYPCSNEKSPIHAYDSSTSSADSTCSAPPAKTFGSLSSSGPPASAAVAIRTTTANVTSPSFTIISLGSGETISSSPIVSTDPSVSPIITFPSSSSNKSTASPAVTMTNSASSRDTTSGGYAATPVITLPSASGSASTFPDTNTTINYKTADHLEGAIKTADRSANTDHTTPGDSPSNTANIEENKQEQERRLVVYTAPPGPTAEAPTPTESQAQAQDESRATDGNWLSQAGRVLSSLPLPKGPGP